jgi:AraC family transcriptional regulator of adaptative response/methylated-DNA-[protein]-cysteine methyltransferase
MQMPATRQRAARASRPAPGTTRAHHLRLVAAACRTIEASDEPPDLAALAAAAGLSRFHFHRLFRQVTGLTPKAWVQARRAQRLQGELARGRSVTDALHAAGFGSASPFYAAAGDLLGMPPRDYRAGGANQAIRFAMAQCTLGALLVAASSRGVCAIAMGDDAEALVRDLERRFPAAVLAGGDRRFEQWVAQVIGFIEAPGTGLDLPLDIRGTAFQRRVWQALRRIPVGKTISYAALAQRIGQPSAVRAVARACASNPLALAVPCHRVVRTDGSLSGYRWGVERKRELLERERRAAVDAARRAGQKPEKSKSMSSGTTAS